MTFEPIDHEARRRARDDHDTSLVLEAGAGTGKTTLLVDRIESLVLSGRATLDRIAAVTFTENAAATMKLRLRERLEKARVDSQRPVVERGRAGAALDILERAPISTIHALCASILQERPLECGVVPGFRMADEAETDLLFGEAWEEWRASRLIEGDDIVLAAVDAGIPLEADNWAERTSLRGLARRMVDERDLEPLVGSPTADLPEVRDALQSLGKRAASVAASVSKMDTLAAALHTFGSQVGVLLALDDATLGEQLAEITIDAARKGDKRNWLDASELERAREVWADIRLLLESWKTARREAFHARLVGALHSVVDLYERKKAERGCLDFLDLLVKARGALRQRESVRHYFRERFPYLLIDEFQDTDPLQVEIARILADDRAGGLVVVGDAKQSIYRFRRAEVELFRRLSASFGGKPGHAVLHLTQNFRSRPSILRFVNGVFGELIQASDEAGQPAYEPIAPPLGLDESPSVIALSFDGSAQEGEDLLRLEAQVTAALVARAQGGGFTVRDPLSDELRASVAGDVMVLTPRLTQLRHLEEALGAIGIPFTVDGGRSFFDRWEVHELLNVLRAIDDPSDRVALVGALRSSFFGISDRDLAAYALDGGYLGLGEADVAKESGPVLAPALAALGRLSRMRRHRTVPRLLEELYDTTRILAALTGMRRGEGQVANLEKVAALARSASSLGVLTLRGFTSFLRERIHTAGEEPDLPATRPGDPNTVRILTIHKAKGLESPITILYDTAANNRMQAESIPLWERGKVAIGFRQDCQPPGWSVLAQKDRARALAESRRLLYVACTRARDFLVVPQPRSARLGDFLRDVVSRLPARSNEDVTVLDAGSLFDELPSPKPAAEAPVLVREDAVAARWEAERKERTAAGAHRPFVPAAATEVAARTAPPSVLPAAAGSGGRDFGRLVHRILERVHFDDEAPQRARAMAESLAPMFTLDQTAAAEAAAAVGRALALPAMQRARRSSAVWRELPLWFPENGTLVEGVVDLVFEEQGGLVIVDYKTDAITAEQALAQAAHHAPQLQLYGRGLAQALGMEVRERLVLFTSPGFAVAV